jgi:predicted AlkP superfamily phosphohydrolase/phosphomutase
MSDHGFGPQHKLFRINQWLIENQFLQLRHSGANGPLAGLSSGAQKWLYRGIGGLSDMVREHISDTAKDRLKRTFPRLRERMASQTLFSGVDWQRTVAYHTAEFPGSIRINLKGREVQGVVESGAEYEAVCAALQTSLQDFCDPQSGKRIVERVYRREELYAGPQLAAAPDLIVHLADYAYTFDWYIPVSANGRQGSLPVIDSLRGKYAVNCGYHRPDGILMLDGADIRAGQELGLADIEDVIPTVLYLLGLPIPAEMDGQVLTAALAEGLLQERAIAYGEPLLDPTADAVPADLYTAEEEEAVSDRLRDLGYL